MTTYNKTEKTIVMNRTDLEHCGFEYEQFLGELFLSGIDDPEAEQPLKIIVDFSTGSLEKCIKS